MKNQKGFATALILILLPLFIAAAVGLYICFAFIEDQSGPRNQCRRELAIGLEQMAIPLQKLLALNSQASLLQIEHRLAVASLAAATAAANPPLIAKATARLQRVLKRMKILDGTQKALLKTAQLILTTSHLAAKSALLKRPIGFLKRTNIHSSKAKPAVRPKTPGLAPIYVLEEPFEKQQALVHRWQSQFALKGPLANFLKAKGSFKNVCAVTLTKEKEAWKAVVIEDKFSSKPSFF